jgi:hypothetical protein
MNKKVKLRVSISLALFIFVFTPVHAQPSDSDDSMSYRKKAYIEYRITQHDSTISHLFIFFDSAGHAGVTRIFSEYNFQPTIYKMNGLVKKYTGPKIQYLINKNKNRLGVNISKVTVIIPSEQTIRKSMINAEETIGVDVYDEHGSLLFQQIDQPFEISAISDDGERICCIVPFSKAVCPIKRMELGGKNVTQCAVKILDDTGHVFYNNTVAASIIDTSFFSSNGKWLAYTTNQYSNCRVLDLSTKQEYVTPRIDKDATSTCMITDEGEVIFSRNGKHINFGLKSYKIMKSVVKSASSRER